MNTSSKLVYLCLSFFIALLTVLIISSENSVTPRIIGGKNAPEGAYPYMVSLTVMYAHFCGGSILNERWILTAAHCNYIIVVVGTNRLQYHDDGEKYAEEMIYHKGWNDHDKAYDVGLVRVDRKIEFNDKVQTIKLPKEDFVKGSCYPATTIGWGNWDRSIVQLSDRLQVIPVRVIRQCRCKREYRRAVDITDAHICTYSKFGEGVCQGDSGGPLIADGVQIGIASFAAIPCASGRPDVFARVSTYLNWIESRINRF